MVERSMNAPRHDGTILPNTDGGDVAKEFKQKRKLEMEKVLNIKIQNLEEKRKTVK